MSLLTNFEPELSTITTASQFIDTFEKIDNYILEKEKILKDLDLKILHEESLYMDIYQEFLETENLLKNLQLEEEKTRKELLLKEEKENFIKELNTKIMENSFDNKIRIVPNEKHYPEDKYFTVEWVLPQKKDSNNIVLYLMFESESRKIVKMNDSQGKILDKENIDWSIFPLNDSKNRNALMLEIYKEYGGN